MTGHYHERIPKVNPSEYPRKHKKILKKYIKGFNISNPNVSWKITLYLDIYSHKPKFVSNLRKFELNVLNMCNAHYYNKINGKTTEFYADFCSRGNDGYTMTDVTFKSVVGDNGVIRPTENMNICGSELHDMRVESTNVRYDEPMWHDEISLYDEPKECTLNSNLDN